MNGLQRESVFHKPAEWGQHERTWMIWPHRDDLYEERLAPMQLEYLEIVAAISQFEPVTVIAHADHAENARTRLGRQATSPG